MKTIRIAHVPRSEAGWFRPVLAVETEQEMEILLQIEALAFREGNKWRFSDGESSFYAEIRDAEFLKRVDDGEAFAKGDKLHVRALVRQYQVGEKLKREVVVLKVLKHIRAKQQPKLF